MEKTLNLKNVLKTAQKYIIENFKHYYGPLVFIMATIKCFYTSYVRGDLRCYPDMCSQGQELSATFRCIITVLAYHDNIC